MTIRKALEDFLRDIAEQQAAQQGRQRPAPRPPVRQLRPAPKAEPLDAEIVELEPFQEESVAKHVQRHINTADIRQHTAELGTQVAQESEKRQSQLREKFSHSVGSIPGAGAGPGPGRDQQPVPTTALVSTAGTTRPSEIVDLLRNPTSIRQAVILNEILTRPEHRW